MLVRPAANERFPVLTLPFCGDIALGNGTQWRFAISRGGNGLIVGIETHGTYSFGHFVHWTYAMEKLGVMEGDAGNVADLINDQLGEMPDERQGWYYTQLKAVV